ncbi:MAG TPA: RNA polymerase sigma factor [Candidatus Solibacter sp.]|nr:RNA polymerase sigma factor [Candidatus Solibacter sp.]
MPGNQEQRQVARAAAGDERAFRSLFDQHHEALFRFAYRLTGSTDAAEDITQECFLRLIEQARFDSTLGSLRQYLYGTVRNLARRRWQAAHREDPWEDESQDDSRPLPDAMIAAEVSDAVQAALDLLPPLQREAVVLFEFEELSLEEIAAVAGADVGTVKSRLHRARERLRRLLAGYRAPVRKGVS